MAHISSISNNQLSPSPLLTPKSDKTILVSSPANTSVWSAQNSLISEHLYMNLLPQDEHLTFDDTTCCLTFDNDTTLPYDYSLDPDNTIIYDQSPSAISNENCDTQSKENDKTCGSTSSSLHGNNKKRTAHSKVQLWLNQMVKMEHENILPETTTTKCTRSHKCHRLAPKIKQNVARRLKQIRLHFQHSKDNQLHLETLAIF